MKKTLAIMIEWIRPAAIVIAYFIAEYFGKDPISKFHILGPIVVMVMSGTVGFESLILKEAASEKIGYKPDRGYQVQSGLNNLATALTALLVFILNWGRYADATIVTAMLIFFTLSAVNHTLSAIKEQNMKPVNLMRPVMTLALIAILVPAMIKALS